VILTQARSALDAAQHPAPASAQLDNGLPAALAAALEAFAGTGNFRDAVLTAANLGGDSDVVARRAGRSRVRTTLQARSPLCGATA